MRILYVSAESPATPAGGIATYLQYVVPAMEAAGHEVFLFTWPKDPAQQLVLEMSPFRPAHTWFCRDTDNAARAMYPGASQNHAVGSYLLPALLRCVEEWRIDVVESTDFLGPAFFLYQHIRTSNSSRKPLCATYYHGFIEDFYEADYLRPPRDRLRDLAVERQQCRISDLVIAPSRAARRRLLSHHIEVPVEVIREPYIFSADVDTQSMRPTISYMGRISLSKGIDALVYLANAIEADIPLEQLLLVGREVATPFKVSKIQDYVRGRLSESLREKVRFAGYMPRDQALSLLNPGEIAPHLGYADTFSYACVESIDHGLLPIVRAGTPMAEFIPPGSEDMIFPESLGTPREIRAHFARLVPHAESLCRESRAFNKAELAPEHIAESLGRTYEVACARKRGRVQVAISRRAGPDDITVLIPAYRPGEVFLETIDSLAAQTLGCPRVIICDDGTPGGDVEWFGYATLRLPRCEILRQPNGGLLAARMSLIAELRTDLAIFLDADDWLAPTYVERVLEAYNTALDTPDAVLTQRWNFDESIELVMPNLLEDYLHLLQNDFRMTALIRAEVLRTLRFDPLRRNGEADDWDFWLRFTAAGYRAEMVPEPLFRYRFRTGTMSWPWSSGQSMGTNAMLTRSIAELLAKRPGWGNLVSRALSSARSFE